MSAIKTADRSTSGDSLGDVSKRTSTGFTVPGTTSAEASHDVERATEANEGFTTSTKGTDILTSTPENIVSTESEIPLSILDLNDSSIEVSKEVATPDHEVSTKITHEAPDISSAATEGVFTFAAENQTPSASDSDMESLAAISTLDEEETASTDNSVSDFTLALTIFSSSSPSVGTEVAATKIQLSSAASDASLGEVSTPLWESSVAENTVSEEQSSEVTSPTSSNNQETLVDEHWSTPTASDSGIQKELSTLATEKASVAEHDSSVTQLDVVTTLETETTKLATTDGADTSFDSFSMTSGQEASTLDQNEILGRENLLSPLPDFTVDVSATPDQTSLTEDEETVSTEGSFSSSDHATLSNDSFKKENVTPKIPLSSIPEDYETEANVWTSQVVTDEEQFSIISSPSATSMSETSTNETDQIPDPENMISRPSNLDDFASTPVDQFAALDDVVNSADNTLSSVDYQVSVLYSSNSETESSAIPENFSSVPDYDEDANEDEISALDDGETEETDYRSFPDFGDLNSQNSMFSLSEGKTEALQTTPVSHNAPTDEASETELYASEHSLVFSTSSHTTAADERSFTSESSQVKDPLPSATTVGVELKHVGTEISTEQSSTTLTSVTLGVMTAESSMSELRSLEKDEEDSLTTELPPTDIPEISDDFINGDTIPNSTEMSSSLPISEKTTDYKEQATTSRSTEIGESTAHSAKELNIKIEPLFSSTGSEATNNEGPESLSTEDISLMSTSSATDLNPEEISTDSGRSITEIPKTTASVAIESKLRNLNEDDEGIPAELTNKASTKGFTAETTSEPSSSAPLRAEGTEPATSDSKVASLTSTSDETTRATETSTADGSSPEPAASTESMGGIPICSRPNELIPDPDDCRNFYMCDDLVPILSSCTEDFHFNPVLERCEDPCTAGCNKSIGCSSHYPSTEHESSTSSSTARSTGHTGTTVTPTPPDESTHERSTPGLTTVSKIDVKTTPESWTRATRKTDVDSTTATPNAEDTDGIATEAVTKGTTSDEQNLISTLTSEGSSPDVSTRNFTVEGRTTEILTPPSASSDQSSATEGIAYTTVQPTSPAEETMSETDVSSPSSESSSVTDEDVALRSLFTAESVTGSVKTTKADCDDPKGCSSISPDASSPIPFAVCPRNDFLSGSHCNEFINCTESAPVLKKCPDGLHFNPTTRVCDWPYQSGCGELPLPLFNPDHSFNCPCKSCLMPSKDSCQSYYLCLGYTAYRLNCSKSLLFDNRVNTCTFSFYAECSLTTTETPPTTTTPALRYTTTRKPGQSSTAKTTRKLSTTTKHPASSSTARPAFKCPSPSGLFKNPDSCSSFYQCSNGRPYKMACPSTLHFSEKTKRCDYPCDAKCDLTLPCKSPVALTSSTSAPDPRCRCQNCKVPSAQSCTSYVICVNGKARSANCPWGQTFDRKKGVCDWAHKVDCRESELCPRPTGLFPYKEDCHKFVHCSNGIPYVKKCPKLLEFDPAKQRCEWPTGRCNKGTPSNTLSHHVEEHRDGFECPKKFGYYADKEHCDKFYYCSLSVPHLKECSEGLLFNPRHLTCDWKSHVRCDSNRHQQPKKCRVYDRKVTCPVSRGSLPHSRCSMYYDCSSGVACAKPCPIGLYFNKTTGMCDLPFNVKCHYSGGGKDVLRDFSHSCSSRDQLTIADPADEACFYRCRNGRVISGCCARGHIYAVNTNKCEKRTKSIRI